MAENEEDLATIREFYEFFDRIYWIVSDQQDHWPCQREEGAYQKRNNYIKMVLLGIIRIRKSRRQEKGERD